MYSNSKPKWVEDDFNFINPYNFVEFEEDVKRKQWDTGNLSGKITCKIIVKTPLAIPDTEKKKSIELKNHDEHYQYPFYSINNKHIIPGSEIRGMVRSAYETMTNSCMCVNNNNILSSRHTFPRLPGLVTFINGSWHLYNAKSRKIRSSEQLSDGEVKRVWYDNNKNKLNYFSFKKINVEIDADNIEDSIKDYNSCIEIYTKDLEKDDYFFKCTYGIKNDGKLYPVFYETVDDNSGHKMVYLSPAQMSRSVYHNKVNDLLATHISCSELESDEVCEACALFGYINKNRNGGKSLASHLRFTDAKEERFISKGYCTLKELSSPKTTSTEFYTKDTKDAKVWTYDYITTGYNSERIGNRNVTTPNRELYNIELNGRKFYLHSSNADYITSEKTNRNSTMELASKDSTFTFDVYFDKINESQLERLIWVLGLGDNNENSNKQFKLGHGKPLGLGSVKIIVSKVAAREFSYQHGKYSILEEKVDKYFETVPFDTNSNTYNDFMRIVDINTTKGYKVSYPIAVDKTQNNINSSASHQWFIGNRSMGEGGTTTKWSVKYVLPPIYADDISLPALKKEPEK